jgi:3-(3-hydroxy-phenyl)propionate hydroxylase
VSATSVLTARTAPTPRDWQAQEFAYQRPAALSAHQPELHPVVVVGAGPVGLSLAIDLAQRLQASGQRVLLLDNDNRLSSGSRAICFAKRTLEIFDRLGVGQRLVDQGVSWSKGRVFLGNSALYSFDLLPEPGHQRPAFINVPQYVVEGELVERAQQLPNLEILWKHEVTALAASAGMDAHAAHAAHTAHKAHTTHAALTLATPDGSYTLHARYVAACDGARSSLRRLMGLESTGRTFQDRFLIADVRIEGELFPADPRTGHIDHERWFWFDPPFHPGQSVLLHRQPGGVWRVDFQLGWQADPEAEKRPEAINPRIQALLQQGFGRTVPFQLVWASVYTFACQRMQSFQHGNVLFLGDAAHGVSPFGARGANSGVQDADNLAWKLAAVLQNQAPESLLRSYAQEREYAADENILNSTRSTDFITPKSEISRLFRDATLQLAREHPFARRLVNSGRLSLPSVLDGSTLSTADETSAWPRDLCPGLRPGAPPQDAPLLHHGKPTWLLQALNGFSGDFCLLVVGPHVLPAGVCPVPVLCIDGQAWVDVQGLVAQRYGQGSYLLRPDGHVAARWREPNAAQVTAAWAAARAAVRAGSPVAAPAAAPTAAPLAAVETARHG